MAPVEMDGTADGGWHRQASRLHLVSDSLTNPTLRSRTFGSLADLGGWHRQRWMAPGDVLPTGSARRRCMRCQAPCITERITVRNGISGSLAELGGWHRGGGWHRERWVAPQTPQKVGGTGRGGTGRGGWHRACDTAAPGFGRSARP